MLKQHYVHSTSVHLEVLPLAHLVFVEVAVQQLLVVGVDDGGPITCCKDVPLPSAAER
jgi:hypothetical protein